MEFTLERRDRETHRTLLDTVLRREETQEVIVPDPCPDILRVADADGMVLLESWEAAGWFTGFFDRYSCRRCCASARWSCWCRR